MIKLVACLTFLLAINSTAAFAGSEQCRLIKLSLERQACYDRQSSSPGAKREPGLSDNPKMMDSVEILKLEDDRLAKRLKGICRGC
jgi:hypothetical protein